MNTRATACVVSLAWAAGALAAQPVPPATRAAMDELWRRGRCVLSSIVLPAQRSAQRPRDLGDTPVVDGRSVSRRNPFTCFAVDDSTMWVGSDARLDRVELTTRRRVATFTVAQGLPDCPIDALVADGPQLWVVGRSGLSRLDIASGRFTTKGLPTFGLARLAPSPKVVWVVADSGTFALERASGTWRTLPAAPAAGTVRQRVAQGLWGVRWRSATERLIDDAAVVGGKLWALVMGSLACMDCADALAGKPAWRQVTRDAWAIRADGDALWVLTSRGVERHGPDGKPTRYTAADGLAAGRYRALEVMPDAVWVVTDPGPGAAGGGLSRFDKITDKWTTLTAINGSPVTRITWLGAGQGRVWVAALAFEKLVTLSAHPGMMHVRRGVPDVTGLTLHSVALCDTRWESLACPLPEGEPRYVLGQRGTVTRGRMVPKAIIGVAATDKTVHALFETGPHDFYGGYCHTVGSLARRASAGAPWEVSFRNLAAATGLEGEQPELLLVSESHGKRVVFAEGQPRALHIGVHAGRAWALTETALACETDRPGTWQKVVETRSRFYWEASAAVADKGGLWVGGDAGTVSRLDRETLECTPLACLKGRKITRLATDGEGCVWVHSEAAKVVLPVELKGLPVVETKGLAVYDGKAWREAKPGEKPPTGPGAGPWQWSVRGKSYLFRRARDGGQEHRWAFVRGVFKPAVLCDDVAGHAVWLKIHEGVLRVDVAETGK